jgi:GT2 family glycosyltransferase
VDNASTDGSADMVAHLFPDVTLLNLGRNTWFCGGNNLGLAVARAEYALMLNPDTVVPPGALTSMVEFMDVHPDYAGATMQLRYPDGGIQRTCSRIPTYAYLLLNHSPLGWLFPGWRKRLNEWHWYTGWERDSNFDVQAVPGSCTLMRREDLRLDENLLLYFPEDDLAQRFAGSKFRFLAEPHIIHREKSSTRTWSATRIYYRDMLVYTRKYHGWIGAALLWLCSRPLYWGMAIRWRFKKPR